jgi:hypothetical protein
MRHIAQADPSHSGYQHMVQSLDSFTHVGPHGQHTCIVFESLGESVLDLQKRREKGRLSLELVGQSHGKHCWAWTIYIGGLVHTGISTVPDCQF